MKIAKLLILLILTCTITDGFAQKKKKRKPAAPPTQAKIEDVPRRPIDTIPTSDPETKIITFSNNTWEYYRPHISSRLSNQDAYRFNWETEIIFAYRNVELADIPNRVELKLVDSLNQFCPPIVGRLSSKYGPRGRRAHQGVDIPLRAGEPLRAVFDGKVRYAKLNTGGYGFMVIIRHANGLETWYAHQTRLNVKSGDFVKAGQIIGFGGNTGRSYGAHLHFEMRYKDQSFDPEFLIDFETGNLRYQNFTLEKRFFNIHSRATDILEEEDGDSDLPGYVPPLVDDSTSVKIQKTVKKTTPTIPAVYHTIKSGDTMGGLAAKYNVSIDQICRLNGMTKKSTLTINKKIRIK